MSKAGTTSATICGFVALLCWGSSVAGTRSLSAAVGPVAAGCCIFGLSAVAVLAYYAIRPAELRELLRIPPRYLLTCGGLFVLYELVYFGALGLSATNEQAIAVSILNYLWPALTLIFSIPLLGIKARPMIAVGVVLALCGVVLVEVDPHTFSGEKLIGTISSNPWPYVMGLTAGVSWALYSALSRRWTQYLTVNPVPLFLLMCAVAFGAFGFRAAIQIHWTGRMLGELAYMMTVVTFLGYWLWNQAMQKGNVVLVVSASYLIPMISVLVSWSYLHATVGSMVWVGCALVTTGSVLCNLSASKERA